MTDSILTLEFQMPSSNKTNCKWRKLYASISHLKMTGICQTYNEMQMTGCRLLDASLMNMLLLHRPDNMWTKRTELMSHLFQRGKKRKIGRNVGAVTHKPECTCVKMCFWIWCPNIWGLWILSSQQAWQNASRHLAPTSICGHHCR